MALTQISAVTIVAIPRGRGNADVTLQISGSCAVAYTLDPDPVSGSVWIATGITNPVADTIAHFATGLTALRLTPTGTIGYALVM